MAPATSISCNGTLRGGDGDYIVCRRSREAEYLRLQDGVPSSDNTLVKNGTSCLQTVHNTLVVVHVFETKKCLR